MHRRGAGSQPVQVVTDNEGMDREGSPTHLHPICNPIYSAWDNREAPYPPTSGPGTDHDSNIPIDGMANEKTLCQTGGTSHRRA